MKTLHEVETFVKDKIKFWRDADSFLVGDPAERTTYITQLNETLKLIQYERESQENETDIEKLILKRINLYSKSKDETVLRSDLIDELSSILFRVQLNKTNENAD